MLAARPQEATRVVRPAEGRLRALAASLVLLSLPPRLVNLDAPPLDRHDFRQTQTAITVRSFLEGHLSVLHYQTPVLGPPWEVPFECPVFQLSAFALARLTRLDLDLACRLAAVLWFYLSAWALFALVRRRGDLRLATVALGAYVLTPFSVQWSRAVLIDFTAVAFALGYLDLALRWASGGGWRAALAAVVLGVLASLTKVTTVLGVVAAGAVLLPGPLRTALRSATRGDRLRAAGWLAAIAGLPLWAGVWWTRWADQIKAASPATATLTSTQLRTWNFGTLAQRATVEPWGTIFGRIGSFLLPGALVLSVPLAGWFLRRAPPPLRSLVLAALAGTLAPILVFFNLYAVHDYYLIAVAPFVAIIAAAGVLQLGSLLPASGRRRWIALTLGVTILSSVPSWQYLRETYQVSREAPIARLGRLIERSTGAAQWVVVQGDEWNSRILYAARRRGFMIWDGRTDVTPLSARPELGALVCRECSPGLLALFPRRSLVGHEAAWDVYRVWSAGEEAR